MSIDNVVADNLKVDRTFESDELIIDRWENGMTTIRKEPLDEEIRIFQYCFPETLEMVSVYDNGYSECNLGDSRYDSYKKQLEDNGLW